MPPCGARLDNLALLKGVTRISIHAPREGRDSVWTAWSDREYAFQSTRPLRGATAVQSFVLPSGHISIHAPHAGRDADIAKYNEAKEAISIHAPHAGRD